MNALEQYYKVLDVSSYDCKDVHTIDNELQQVIKQLVEEGEHIIAANAELDRQGFSVRKSFDTQLDPEKGTINGLSWKFSGTQTLEDGSEIPLYWPNVASFTQEAFEYFYKRYNECENLFAKTEYGLMVYFGEMPKNAKHNAFKTQLFNDLFTLSKQYYAKASLGGDKNYYSSYFFLTLRLAFGIAERANLQPELSTIIKYFFNIHQNWDISKTGTLRILLDLSRLMSDYFGKFKKLIDFQAVLDKNIQGANELERTNIWGSLSALDINLLIEQKRGNPLLNLKAQKAKLYEKLAIDAERNSNISCIEFIEQALRIYQELDDFDNSKRLEIMYSDLRGKFSLSEIRQEFPKEFNDSMHDKIIKTVLENDERGVIQTFIISPWYDTIQNITDRSIELRKQFVLSSTIPVSIADKFGNTVDVFNTEAEKEKFNFWRSYTMSYQVGTQTMYSFFIEAYKAGKLNYSNVIDYLENTWFNEIITRKYHGQIVEVKPLDTLKPGLKRIFEEFDRYFADNKNEIDFITIIDSLTLKVEGLLRYFCERLGKATFKTRQRGSDKLVMEKLLDDLLADIAHKPPYKPEQETNFDEEDRIYIKFIMSEQAGLNLRNKVAHSLMDIFEYSFEHVVVLFCIILRLSKYKFVEDKGGKVL